MKQTTYYLWKGEDTGQRVIYHITDYKETNKEGLVKIDGHGWLKLELVKEGPNKFEVMSFAK